MVHVLHLPWYLQNSRYISLFINPSTTVNATIPSTVRSVVAKRCVPWTRYCFIVVQCPFLMHPFAQAAVLLFFDVSSRKPISSGSYWLIWAYVVILSLLIVLWGNVLELLVWDSHPSLKATILNGWWVIAPWMFHPIEHQYQVSRLSLTWILNEGWGTDSLPTFTPSTLERLSGNAGYEEWLHSDIHSWLVEKTE